MKKSCGGRDGDGGGGGDGGRGGGGREKMKMKRGRKIMKRERKKVVARMINGGGRRIPPVNDK